MIRSVISVVVTSLGVRHFVLVLCISAPLFAAIDVPKPKASVCGLTPAEGTSLNVDPSADAHALSDYRKAIHVLLKNRRFDQLDCLADSARSQREMFPGGIWKLHTIYSGLEAPLLHPTQQDWERHISLVREWVSAKPKSITPRIALAESYVNYGWDARGSGFADTVSESGWKLLDQRVSQALQVLKEARSLPTKCPEGYVAMQQVALAQGWSPNDKQMLLKEAVQFEPAYYYYYRAYAISILPKWDGQEGDLARFLKNAADRVAGDSGDILYFQVGAYVACLTDDQLKLSWPRIQKGFRALEQRNGSALENTNYLARLAYMYQDPLVANRMFARIGEQWSEHIWGTFNYFDSMRKWAKQMSSMMRSQNEEEEAAEANSLTVEGQRYKAAIDQTIDSMIPDCIKEDGIPTGDFEMLFQVQKDGMIDKVDTVGTNRVGVCVMKNLQATRAQNRAVFPPPPKPDYWIRYDLLPERFASEAMK